MPQAPAAAPPPLRLDVTTTASLHVVASLVDGRQEKILVNAQGLPLYYFKSDTAKKSKVTGELARLWPPLTGAKPTGSGVAGKLTSTPNAGGRLVAYNGHFLYSFVEDSPGRVTGQGVSGFLVATPGLKTLGAASRAQFHAPVATGGSGYGY
jgi:predicted lipoprotein with Yx(FWY)xxD motif